MKVRARSLRTQLLAAIVFVVLLSAAISLVAGALLTRRAVDRSVLQDVSQQADLLAKRERVALLPLAHLESLQPFLVRQHERLVVAPLGRPSKYLRADARGERDDLGRRQGVVLRGASRRAEGSRAAAPARRRAPGGRTSRDCSSRRESGSRSRPSCRCCWRAASRGRSGAWRPRPSGSRQATRPGRFPPRARPSSRRSPSRSTTWRRSSSMRATPSARSCSRSATS